jgi:hypothetical protein
MTCLEGECRHTDTITSRQSEKKIENPESTNKETPTKRTCLAHDWTVWYVYTVGEQQQ